MEKNKDEDHLDAMNDLIERGGPNFVTKAVLVAVRTRRLDVMKYLVEEKGANLRSDEDGEDHQLITPLAVASQKDCLSTVEYMVEKGADVNQRSGKLRQTPVMIAAQRGHRNVVEYLVRKKADVSLLDEDEYTALLRASESGHLDVVQYLVQSAGAADAIAESGVLCMTPLWAAFRKDEQKVAEYLVKGQEKADG